MVTVDEDAEINFHQLVALRFIAQILRGVVPSELLKQDMTVVEGFPFYLNFASYWGISEESSITLPPTPQLITACAFKVNLAWVKTEQPQKFLLISVPSPSKKKE